MKGKYLQSKPGDVVDEITSLKEKYIYFLYDEMFLNTKKVTRIAILMMERGVKKIYKLGKKRYHHFSKLYITAMRNNPLRMNNIKIPFRNIARAISTRTRFVVS